MVNETKLILQKLEKIEKNVEEIREHMEDAILTEDDIRSIREADKEFREGKTVSHANLKKELGI
ncbi:MAG: hypothetical protein HYS32_03770 [Candidatus Woesearchaeota archaeon]|nr:MAG: hypothetical protein HYS32_03770 [Candidatus Woesearchaeota archaeon]